MIYIDESGNLGRDGKYFVITALVTDNQKRISNLVRNTTSNLNSRYGNVKELKGFHLDFKTRQNFLNRLARVDDFKIYYIVADKKHLQPRLFKDKNICFNYLASFVVREIVKDSGGDHNIIFDNRTVKVSSVLSLADYLRTQAYAEWNCHGNMDIQYGDSERIKNLQAVDILSNTIYQKYDRNLNHSYNIISKHCESTILFPYKKFGN